MKPLILVAASALLVTLAAPAYAADSDAALFTAMDTNNDNVVVWDEFKASHPTAVLVMFNALDKNRNTYIEKDEWMPPKLDPDKQYTPFGVFPKD